MYHILIQTLFGSRGIQWSRARVLALDSSVTSFNFVRTVRLFFDFFLFKGPFKFLDILQQTEVPKSPKALLPYQLFWHYKTVSKFSFFVVFRRSRLVQTIFIVLVNFGTLLERLGVNEKSLLHSGAKLA